MADFAYYTRPGRRTARTIISVGSNTRYHEIYTGFKPVWAFGSQANGWPARLFRDRCVRRRVLRSAGVHCAFSCAGLGFCRRLYAAQSILARTLGALSSISRRGRLLCLLGCALSQNDLIPGFLRALAPGPRLRALTRPGFTDGLYLPGLLRDRGFVSLRPFLGAALDSSHPGWTFELPPRYWSA